MFGVPDVITDMTRSLEMVERSRLMYWKVVFGHRRGFGVCHVHTGVPEGLPEPPGERYGPYGP